MSASTYAAPSSCESVPSERDDVGRRGRARARARVPSRLSTCVIERFQNSVSCSAVRVLDRLPEVGDRLARRWRGRPSRAASAGGCGMPLAKLSKPTVVAISAVSIQASDEHDRDRGDAAPPAPEGDQQHDTPSTADASSSRRSPMSHVASARLASVQDREARRLEVRVAELDRLQEHDEDHESAAAPRRRASRPASTRRRAPSRSSMQRRRGRSGSAPPSASRRRSRGMRP